MRLRANPSRALPGHPTPKCRKHSSHTACACARSQMRAFTDGGSSSYPCTEDTTTICSGWGSTHSSCNLGGHDYMNNLVRQLTNAQETGHCGFPLVGATQAAADLHQMGVPAGSHTFAMRYHHGQNSNAATITATLGTGNTWSSVPSSMSQASSLQFDIAM